MSDCVYVTDGWGVHDERWTDALLHLGHQPAIVSRQRQGLDPRRMRDRITPLIANGAPILAGPLGSVTRHLIGLPTRVVGLSWGFDLYERASSDDLKWLQYLDRLVVDSEATRNVALSAGVAESAITLLPWGIDLTAFEAIRSAEGSNRLMVLSLRAHEPTYRVQDILEAFAVVAESLPDADLVIGHSGSLTGELRDRASALGIDHRVDFIGTVHERDVAPLMQTAAVYVTASSIDGTSVTLLQAMACGTPVVASNIPGNLGWIRPGVTGRIFPTGDVAALASALLETLQTDPSSQAFTIALTEGARALVERDADWARNLDLLEAALFG